MNTNCKLKKMKRFFTQGRLVTLVVAGVLIIDQLIKIAVKTNMYLHENIHVTDWQSTSRALLPLAGPTMPAFSNWSMMRPARL